jgi:D-alanyl-D-alanine dipeptidase
MEGDPDPMDPVSRHRATGVAEAASRGRLRAIMETARFRAYECEWWHYTLADEPCPRTYFASRSPCVPADPLRTCLSPDRPGRRSGWV